MVLSKYVDHFAISYSSYQYVLLFQYFAATFLIIWSLDFLDNYLTGFEEYGGNIESEWCQLLVCCKDNDNVCSTSFCCYEIQNHHLMVGAEGNFSGRHFCCHCYGLGYSVLSCLFANVVCLEFKE